jgi:Flp pilus assembly protein CpaB
MRDPQLIGLIFLLAVAVVAAYFYLKRAQRRTPEAATDETPQGETHPASSWNAPAGSQPGGQTGTQSSAAAEQPPSGTERGT